MAESIPPSATTTPKRKRSQMLTEDIVIPSDVNVSSPQKNTDNGNYSPRTRITHRFHNLTIGHSHPPQGGSRTEKGSEAPLLAVAPRFIPQEDGLGEAMDEDTEVDVGARKRFKPDEPIIPQPPAEEDNFTTTARVKDAILPKPKPSVAFSLDRPGTPPLKSPSPRKAKHSISDTQPQQSLPSPPSQTLPPPSSSTSSEASTTTSPPDFRAALTWQEEEITIYDPDDSDDDGTGINGIGFKPTAAVAYARGMKRKQQLAEYRKREEREARARRNMRRRGTPTPVPEGIKGKERDKDKEMMKKVRDRRVRFLEATGGIPRVGFEGGKPEGVQAGQ